MSDAIEFKPRYHQELAMLGAIQVGAVMPMDSTRPDGRAQWIAWLPDEQGSRLANWKEVKSVEKAKTALSEHVASWLKRAGLTQSEKVPG
jgi:hypothetical protein